MKIVFMGTPKFSVRILESLAKKYEVCLVVTQPDKVVGRKNEKEFNLVKKKAIELGITVFQPEKIRKEYAEVLNAGAEVLVTAAYGQMIPKIILNSFKKCINVHASMLPKYRGGAPIQRSIINGDKTTGITIMEMIKQMDAGCIYAQKEIDILAEDNNTSLFEKLSMVGEQLLMANIEDIVSGRNKGVQQQEELVTYAYNITREEEKIDFTKSNFQIFNHIRGLALEPGAYTIIHGEVIKVYSSIARVYEGDEKPGTILDLKKKILVKTSDGAIEFEFIKPAGKKMMKAIDYVNGQRLLKVGDVFD